MEAPIASLAAGVLSFVAATLSSAGGVGGGSLYLPILNLVAGLDLKTASTFSAFMVTGGSLSNVLYGLISTTTTDTKSLIDHDIALLSEPCMLLGVSAGVLGNAMFPEWLITVLFALFLSFSTYKTFRAGFRCWSAESRAAAAISVEEKKGSMEEALLLPGKEFEGDGVGIPWRKLGVLLMVWLCFFGLHVLIAAKVTFVRSVSLSLIPSSSYSGFYSMYSVSEPQITASNARIKELPTVVFPLAALMSGILGGLFGIGGGMLINPVLQKVGGHSIISATSF